MRTELFEQLQKLYPGLVHLNRFLMWFVFSVSFCGVLPSMDLDYIYLGLGS